MKNLFVFSINCPVDMHEISYATFSVAFAHAGVDLFKVFFYSNVYLYDNKTSYWSVWPKDNLVFKNFIWMYQSTRTVRSKKKRVYVPF